MIAAQRLSAPMRFFRRTGPALWLYAGSTASLLASSAAQLVTFAILARGLGVEQFGVLMAVTAITNVAVQLCGVGGSETVVRCVARDPTCYASALGHSLVLLAGSGTILVLLLAASLPHFFALSLDPLVNAAALAVLIITNVVLVRWVVLVEQIYIARWEVTNANAVNVGFAFARTAAAALGCGWFGVSTVVEWAFWHGACHVIVAAACAFSLRRFGAPRWTILRGEVKLGAYFTTPFVFQALRQNADLLVLTALTSPQVVGAFSVARRVVDTSFLAVNALLRVAYPRLAVLAEAGLRETLSLGWKMLAAAVAIAAGMALALYLLAPLLAALFGKDFAVIADYLRVMCWAVVLVAVSAVAAEILGASGRHAIRAAIYNGGSIVGAASVAVLTFALLLPGTFIALYVIETVLAVVFWASLMFLVRNEDGSSDALERRIGAQP